MEEPNQRMLNPWRFHLQKLALELKCPICLDLLNQPVLLPCNHLFCNSCIQEPTPNGPECPVCKSRYVDQDIRPAPYMENVVNVYKSFCSTSLAKIFHPSSDVGRLSENSPVSTKTNHELDEEAVEGNSANGKSVSARSVNKRAARTDQEGEKDHFGNRGEMVQETHMNQKEQLSQDNRSLGEMRRDSKRQKKSNLSEAKSSKCCFCHSSEVTEETGPMLHCAKQKLVDGDFATSSKVTHVHQLCFVWTPQVYFEDDKIKNLEAELARAAKLKCSRCGKKGAALGCYVTTCRKTYHIPCALEISECRWDSEDFLLLCPFHKSIRFPREELQFGKHASIETDPVSTEMISQQSNSTLPDGEKTLVFCGSALSPEDKCILVKYASGCGATVSKFWRSDITHVIAATDPNGACTRTMKFLLAILHGTWVVTMDWIKACVEANKPVEEAPYEVGLDNHGSRHGPKLGRLLVSNNVPKLFNRLKFYFSGDFVPYFKNDFLTLVITAGGNIIETKEQLVAQSQDVQSIRSTTLVVFNSDPTPGNGDSLLLQRLEAADLAERTGSTVIEHTWILESIAAYNLRPLA